MRFRRFGLGFITVVCLMGAMLTGLSAPAHGQVGQALAIAELMKPEFVNRDMIIFVEGLKLDEEQQIIVESMFDNYQYEFEAGLDGLRKGFEDIRGDINPDDPERVLKIIFAPFEKWRDQREGIRQQFLNNVKLVLGQQQLDRWDSFLKRLRREKSMDRGILSGESLNIFHVLQDMSIPETMRAVIEPLLTEYENELDKALEIRDLAINDTKGDLLQAMTTQDEDAMLQFMERQISRRVAVRNVNDHYLDAITAALPGEVGREFYEKAMMRGYPRVFRRTSAGELFRAALELKSIDEAKLASITEMYATYTTNVQDYDRRLLEMTRAHEPIAERQRNEAGAAKNRDEPYSRMPNPTVAEFRKRDDMVRQTVDLLRWSLGEEQFALLPGATRWLQPKNENADPDGPRQRVTGQNGNPDRGSDSATGMGNRGLTSPKPTSQNSGQKKKNPDDPGAPDE